MSERAVLADVNVWLASIVEEHPHHQRTKLWWSKHVIPSGTRVAFCRMTQLGFLRLLNNERVMGARKRTVVEAWHDYQQLISQKPVAFVREPRGLEDVLATFCKLGGSSRNFWTDAYLAAFAEAGELAFATFDRGFERFPNLDLRLLSQI